MRYTLKQDDWNGLHVIDSDGLTVATFSSVTPEFLAGALAAGEMVAALNNVRDLVYDAANGHPINCKELANEMLFDVDAALDKAREAPPCSSDC